MTWKDNTAGWVTVTLWPAYLKMGKDENGNRPAKIAFGKELYTEIVKLMKNRQYNVIGPDDKPALPDDKFMAMEMVYDEVLGDDGWEIRWGA